MNKYENIQTYLTSLIKDIDMVEFESEYQIPIKKIKEWCSGEVIPNEESLFSIAEIFGLPYNFFVGITNTPYTLLAEKRLEKGYTINHLANKLGIKSKNLRDYEIHMTFPSEAIKNKLLSYLKCSEDIFPLSTYDSFETRYYNVLENKAYQQDWVNLVFEKFEKTRISKYENN